MSDKLKLVVTPRQTKVYRTFAAKLTHYQELAQKSCTSEAQIVLRLAAALREALQEKENAVAIAAQFKRTNRVV